MDLSKEHDRKGLVATVLIHTIILLLMLIWVIGQAEDMIDDPAGGVEVSFGEPDNGGSANRVETTPTETTPTPKSNPSPAVTPEDPVVTNDQSDAPEVETSPTPQQTNPSTTTNDEPAKESSEPSISEAQKALERFKNRKKTGGQNQSTGDGKDGPKGQPDARKPGKGGNSKGSHGGHDYDLDGFGVAKWPSVRNQSQEDGNVKVYLCINNRGEVIRNRVIGGTTTSTYLKNLSKDAVKKMTFSLTNTDKEMHCGTITFKYRLQ